MKIKQSIMLSAIIDKMELKINNPKASKEEVGADLFVQLISKAHRAEKEIYNFIAEEKGITVEKAAEIDLVEYIKELGNISGLKSFFMSVVK